MRDATLQGVIDTSKVKEAVSREWGKIPLTVSVYEPDEVGPIKPFTHILLFAESRLTLRCSLTEAIADSSIEYAQVGAASLQSELAEA